MSFSLVSIANKGWNGVTSSSYTLTESVAPNDLLLIQWETDNSNANTPLTISDSVNSGNYSTVDSLYTGGSNVWGISFMACNATGTPVISWTSPFQGGAACISHWTGFTAPPTLDLNASASATGTAVSNSGNTTHGSELVLPMLFGGGSYTAAPSSPWASTFNGGIGGIFPLYYQIVTNPGAVSVSATISNSELWQSYLVGFYNGAGSVASSYYIGSQNYF